MSANARRVLYGILLAVLLVPAFCITTVVGTAIFTHLLLGEIKPPVKGETPAKFPVLVVTPDVRPGRYQARVLFQEELAEYLAAHPKHSYLVPEGQKDALKRYLKENAHIPEGDGWFTSGEFIVAKRRDGRQVFKVTRSTRIKSSNTGWYITDGRSITPLYFWKFDDHGQVTKAIILALITSTIIYVAVIYIYIHICVRRAREERRQTSPARNG